MLTFWFSQARALYRMECETHSPWS